MLLSRARIRVYWPVIAWAVFLLLVCFQHWWSMFGMRNRHDWTFLQFAIVLLNVILIYMVAALVLPDFSQEAVELKENFYAHRGWFFLLAFASVVVSVCKDVILDGRLPYPTNLTFHAILGRALLIGALTPRERHHKTLVVFVIGTFVFYIILLYTRIQ